MKSAIDRSRSEAERGQWLLLHELPQRYAMSAVSALAIVEPSGQIDYLGGYTERKQGPNVEDVTFYRRARAGARLAALPLFGCAVSQALRGQLDPLSLRSLVLGEK